MLNLDVFRKMTIEPAPKPKPKAKKRVVRAKRPSPKQVGEAVGSAVLAVIAKYGPIKVSEIAAKTKHSQAGIRSSIARLNKDDLFFIEKRKGGPNRRDVSFYSLKGQVNA